MYFMSIVSSRNLTSVLKCLLSEACGVMIQPLGSESVNQTSEDRILAGSDASLISRHSTFYTQSCPHLTYIQYRYSTIRL
ncbi:hypothetical protein RRG08_058876 [Elysia crispata]|uniref:Uncharacterized protein n=1 Tax=Elysia crispata TaxID=231223 RepID=A0AAE1CPW3_9GAST|nr:hypothetical protein RRG08_058876 [Elysia crispata]